MCQSRNEKKREQLVFLTNIVPRWHEPLLEGSIIQEKESMRLVGLGSVRERRGRWTSLLWLQNGICLEMSLFHETGNALSGNLSVLSGRLRFKVKRANFFYTKKAQIIFRQK
jgi:hypothetical protein